MSWNYRILDFVTHLALHEVHYDGAGHPKSFTAEPCTFVADHGEAPAAIAATLAQALSDARSRPVLVVSGTWPDFARPTVEGLSLSHITLSYEAAARLAERANIERDHDIGDKSAGYLDGYTAGLERAAKLIRDAGAAAIASAETAHG